MSKQHRGEHSRSVEQNEHEKPLKKARYLWEVKGKHHLKDNCKLNNNNKKKCIDKMDKVEETSTMDDLKSYPKHIPNCENKDSCNCLQQFLAKSEDIMDNIEEELDLNPLEDVEDFPLSLLGPQEKNNDYYLRKWQARQIARGFVDNTINSVLETWTTRPPDTSDFVENCCNDGQVEDDAILMAIQEHGLQSRAEPRGRGRLQFSSELKEQMASILVRESSENCSNSPDRDFGGYPQAEENLEFINAAVSAAIEKKGLSYGF